MLVHQSKTLNLSLKDISFYFIFEIISNTIEKQQVKIELKCFSYMGMFYIANLYSKMAHKI